MEIQYYTDYEYVVINADLGSAFESLASIIRNQRCKTEFQKEKIDNILKSFNLKK